MKNLLILCVFLIRCLFGNESDSEEFPSLPSTELVSQLVSPVTGQLNLSEVDLVVNCVEPLQLKRYFIPPAVPFSFGFSEKERNYYLAKYFLNPYDGWQVLPHLWLETEKNTIYVTLPSGAKLKFFMRSDRLEADRDQQILRNYTNMQNDEASAQVHLRGVACYGQKQDNTILVRTPNGISYVYEKYEKKEKKDGKWGRRYFRLAQEILPSGRVIWYHYKKGVLKSLELKDPLNRFSYGKIDIKGFKEESLETSFTTNHGDKATYSYDTVYLEGRTFVFEVIPLTNKGDVPKRLKKVSSPFFSSEEMNYSGPKPLITDRVSKNSLFKVHYDAVYDRKYYACYVSEILLPIGENGSWEPAYKFKYNKPVYHSGEGYSTNFTDVTGPDGTFTRYYIDGWKRIIKIEWFDQNGEKKQEKLYDWSDKGRIQSITVPDFYTKSFEYDKRGNPILEIFTGAQGEKRQIQRRFSDDYFHLLIEERYDNGLCINFEYLPRTNLVTQKVITDTQGLFLYEQRDYDDAHNLIRKLVRDGPSQKITRYILRNEAPHQHMPEWIEEGTEETSGFALLRKVHLIYDSRGYVKEEHHYDANGAFCYTIHKEFNARGELLSETNPIGQTAYYTYDDHGHKLSEISFGAPLKKEWEYDQRGLLKKEISDHTLFYEYDKNDNPVVLRDQCGSTKHFSYDPIHKKIRETLFEDRLTSSTYDAFGREIEKIAPNGAKTTFLYNSYNQITQINHPNHTSEHRFYTPDGFLKEEINQEGESTIYSYDSLGRVIKKDHEGSIEKFSYWGTFLSTYQDPEGHITYYTYDSAGRKIKETRDTHTITYKYNSLGMLIHTQEGEKETLYTRDFLGRTLSETIHDLTTSYAYDATGNIRTITKGDSTEAFTYDTSKRVIEYISPLGEKTTTTYKETQTLQKITEMPNGLIQIDTYNAFGELIQSEIPSTRKQTFTYNTIGCCLEEVEEIYKEGLYQKTLITQKEYTIDGKLSSITRGFNTNSPRTTLYTYTPSGKIASVTKPSGVTLFYTYNRLGQLIQLTSSEGTINHSFTYNKLGHITSGNGFTRVLDPFGNVLEESFETGLTLKKTYDTLNRPLTITLPDESSITYTYDATHMRSVTRKGYTHTYYTYDTCGRPTSETLHTRTFDSKGQPLSLISPFLCQLNTYDNSGNLIRSTINETTSTYTYDNTSQLLDPSAPFDSHYNQASTNALDELSLFPYDFNGNLLEKSGYTLTYDALDRLIKAEKKTDIIWFTYDALGRRLTKNETLYLYDDQTEIGSFSKDQTQQELRTLGAFGRAIALELESRFVVPIFDLTGTLHYLIDPDTQLIVNQYEYTPFGEPTFIHEQVFNPWGYASKRLDPELGLIYFGLRYYDPETKRWITRDPLDPSDCTNAYTFVLNNPFRYYDKLGLTADDRFDEYTNMSDYPGYKSLFKETGAPKFNLSHRFTVGSVDIPNGGILYINGIFNTYQNCQASAEMISQMAGGAKVTALYNSTHGPADLAECAYLACKGINYSVNNQILEAIQDFFDNAPEESFLLIISHSQGAFHLKNALPFLPKALRDRIISVAIAPGAIITEELCSKTYNYVSTRDFVPYLALGPKAMTASIASAGAQIASIKSLNKANSSLVTSGVNSIRKEYEQIIRLKPHPNAPFWDHSFNSPTYKTHLQRQIDDYLIHTKGIKW